MQKRLARMFPNSKDNLPLLVVVWLTDIYLPIVIEARNWTVFEKKTCIASLQYTIILHSENFTTKTQFYITLCILILFAKPSRWAAVYAEQTHFFITLFLPKIGLKYKRRLVCLFHEFQWHLSKVNIYSFAILVRIIIIHRFALFCPIV